jgi:hypothetical protein
LACWQFTLKALFFEYYQIHSLNFIGDKSQSLSEFILILRIQQWLYFINHLTAKERKKLILIARIDNVDGFYFRHILRNESIIYKFIISVEGQSFLLELNLPDKIRGDYGGLFKTIRKDKQNANNVAQTLINAPMLALTSVNKNYNEIPAIQNSRNSPIATKMLTLILRSAVASPQEKERIYKEIKTLVSNKNNTQELMTLINNIFLYK